MPTISQYAAQVDARADEAVAMFGSQGVSRVFAHAQIYINLQRRIEAAERGDPYMTPANVEDWLLNGSLTFISEQAAQLADRMAELSNPPVVTVAGLRAEAERLRGLDGVLYVAKRSGL